MLLILILRWFPLICIVCYYTIICTNINRYVVVACMLHGALDFKIIITQPNRQRFPDYWFCTSDRICKLWTVHRRSNRNVYFRKYLSVYILHKYIRVLCAESEREKYRFRDYRHIYSDGIGCVPEETR